MIRRPADKRAMRTTRIGDSSFSTSAVRELAAPADAAPRALPHTRSVASIGGIAKLQPEEPEPQSEPQPLPCDPVGTPETVESVQRQEVAAETNSTVQTDTANATQNVEQSGEQQPAQVAAAEQKGEAIAPLQLQVRIGSCSREGLYHDNEDREASAVHLNECVSGFVAVFDGHGGEHCAEYASRVMRQHVLERFKSPTEWINGEEVLKEMFHDVEREFCEIARCEDDTSGSCATVVVVNDDEALVANIGDCRAVVVYPSGTYKVITDDHRADSPTENARIERAGGSVVNGRVFNLQPSRSFGDLDVKEVAGEQVIIPTPEVCRVRMEKGAFMVVATDGLWDSVSTKQAMSFAAKVLKITKYDPEIAAEKLVQLAVERRATDDVTVAVIVWDGN